MKRRGFLKGLLFGSTVVAVPSIASIGSGSSFRKAKRLTEANRKELEESLSAEREVLSNRRISGSGYDKTLKDGINKWFNDELQKQRKKRIL